MSSKYIIRSVSVDEVPGILKDCEGYMDNPRVNFSQFTKYIGHPVEKYLWYGVFVDGKCMSLAYLMKGYPDGFILLSEIQSFVKGYGRPLLEDIIRRSKNIWWCADPEGGESLLEYYRQFGLEEYLINMSKWTDTPEYAFFKVSDDDHRKQIIMNLMKADKTSDHYQPDKLKIENI